MNNFFTPHLAQEQASGIQASRSCILQQNLYFLSVGNTQTGEVQGVIGDKNLYNRFILDSRASTYLVRRKDIFIQYNDFDRLTSNGVRGS
jgi:hypothetical protein